MKAVLLRDMHIADSEAVSVLAHKIWWAHYPGIISDEQIEYMLRLMYAPEYLTQQIKSGERRFRVAEEDEKIIAFISVSKPDEKTLFIHRFYVEQTYRNQGVGTRLLQDTIARYPEVRRVKLHVNRNNSDSIAYYRHKGFETVGERDTDIGEGFVMRDFIMQRELAE